MEMGGRMSKDKLPATWQSTNDVYDKYKAARPTAVWNPYDGTWREMRKRLPDTRGPHDPNGDDGHAEFVRRSEQLHRDYRAGLITDEILKAQLSKLVDEYT